MGKYIKGLSKDTGHMDQPEGTWRYARNIQIHPVDGVLSNEHGMELLSKKSKPGLPDNTEILPEGSIVIGSIEINDDRVILFLTFNTTFTDLEFDVEYNSEIGILENDSYTTLFRPNRDTINTTVSLTGTDFNLNFNQNHFIEGTYKINPDGELFVYWVDNVNPPRAMNITRQQEWLNNSGGVGQPFERLYGLDPESTSNPSHIRMLDLFPSSGPVPHVEFNSINPGGNLLTGVYFLALAYVDRDLVATNYVTLANPISIVEDIEGVLPIERYDGAPAAVPSGKSITWNVSNLNTDYEYLRPVVIRKSDGKRTTFKLNDLPIKNVAGAVSLNSVTFTGLEGFNGFDNVEDVIVDTVSYETAKTINQLDGSLYLGNVKGSKDVGYQPYANYISSRPALHPFPFFDPHEATIDVLEHGYIESSPENLQGGNIESRSQGFRHNKNIYKYKGYTRDEVYAFYIAFILNDGTESYAYHIPGRAPLRLNELNSTGAFQYESIPTYNFNNSIIDANNTLADPDINAFGLWESCDIYPLDPDNALRQITNNKGRAFHFFETSMLEGSRNMNYWQNTGERYPTDELNAFNWEILNASTPGRNEGSLAGRRVRHHHFPSNENAEYQSIHSNTSTIDIVLDVKEVYSIDFRWGSDRVTRLGVGIVQALPNNQTIFGKLAELYEGISDSGSQAEGYMNGDLDITEVAALLGADGFTGDNQNGDEKDIRYIFDTNNNSQTFMFYELNADDSTVYPQIGDKISANWLNTDVDGTQTVGAYASESSSDAALGPYFPDDHLMDNSNYDTSTYGSGEYTFKQSRNESQDDMVNRKSAGACKKRGGRSRYSTGCISTKKKSIARNYRTQAGAMGDVPYDYEQNNFSNAYNSSKLTVVLVDKRKKYIVARAKDKNLDGHFELDNNRMQATQCRGWVHWKSQNLSATDGGYIAHYVRSLGVQFEDLKVPQEIWEKTQGFRIYYANREHHDRRILGQNTLNPYATTEDPIVPACTNSISDFSEISDESYGLDSSSKQSKEHWWINFPYNLEETAYVLPNPADAGMTYGYQALSFHDFYLMRGHGPSGSGEARKSITAATHLKLDYIVENIAFSGPYMPQNVGDGYAECHKTYGSTTYGPVVNGMQTSFNFYSPSQSQDPAVGIFNGGTDSFNLYQWLQTSGTHVDLNRPIKERGKTYLNGDSIYNGKQLGFGRKTWNNFGESHISLLLNEKFGTLPAFNLPTTLPWIDPEAASDAFFEPHIGKNNFQPFLYQANMHAFRLDMYNPFDKQDLVWTGYEVTGDDYDWFKVDDIGNPIENLPAINYLTSDTYDNVINAGGQHPSLHVGNIAGAANPDYPNSELNKQTNPPIEEGGVFDYTGGGETFYAPTDQVMTIKDYIKVASQPALDKFRTGHIFGGDTFISRHGYRKTGRLNLVDLAGSPMNDVRRRDLRYIYHTIVESTDNINFRHVDNRKDSYFPGTPAKDVLLLKNTTDGTDVDNMKYNEDYSSVNSIGSTVPLPIQISQPTSFPNRVIRSATSDDSTLLDNYRIFLALQFKDLPKNRGDLWKISVFNNLLYFHMEDSIFRTKGKQTMQMADQSEAFIGSGDLFAQPPEELKQTEAGYGGTQSQFATTVGDFGYFYVDQRNASVHMIADQIYDISSVGLEKWFQTNLPYKLKVFGKVNYPDNPLSFGFTSVYDEIYQRVLLTKRELIPSALFLQGWQNFIDQNDTDPIGMIQYIPANSTGNANGVSNASDQFIIKLPDIDPDPNFLGEAGEQDNPWTILPVEDEPYRGNGRNYFQRDGWTASYSPKLQSWISFHDYTPYLYTYTSSALYSFKQFPTMTSRGNVHSNIWKHNYTSTKGTYYGRTYPSEIEIIHNENKFVNKLFYNFCWITDRTSQAQDSNDDYGGCPQCGIAGGSDNAYPDVDYTANLLTTKTHGPGFDKFVLYNSHQASGVINIEELLNARKNGCEWCINKFRDLTRESSPNFLSEGRNNDLYYALHTPNMFSAQIGGLDAEGEELDIGGVMVDGGGSLISTPPNQLPLWIISDMHETFNNSAVYSKITAIPRPRKFIDKWLAIRLITSNTASFLVNLYSTEVGARKFHRHEQNQQK
tara:strand:+ start:2698 stop:8964 length:6267 start_codon:yes stop_codon:yes gene_type:complete